jgi:hypothetical protein
MRLTIWFCAVVGCVLIALLFVQRGSRQHQAVSVSVAGVPQVTSTGTVFTVVLSNGTGRSQNIVNDTDGNALFALDDGRKIPSGSVGKHLGRVRNDLKLNLAPGASLTNSVVMSNVPPRFRLRVLVRDLEAEGGAFPLSLLPDSLRRNLLESRPQKPLPASEWIEGTGR